MFSQLTSVSAVFEVNGEASILATFVTTGGVPGSAVCGFKLQEIENKLYQEFASPTGPAPWSQTPHEHPAQCIVPPAKSSIHYMAENEPLVPGSVPVLTGESLLIRTVFPAIQDRDLLTSIQVQTVDPKLGFEKALVVLGTSRSKLLRATINLAPNTQMGNAKILELLSEQDVYLSGCYLRGLESIEIDFEKFKIFGYQPGCIVSLPLSICGVLKCQDECLNPSV